MTDIGIIINLVSFKESKNRHIPSVFKKGLWGWTDTTKHRNKWSHLARGQRVLLYGDKGIRMAGHIEDTNESNEPVNYWIKDPPGYPLHISMKLITKSDEGVQPITRKELGEIYNIPIAKLGFRGFALVLFGDTSKKGITYPIEKFNRIWNEFMKRNRPEGPIIFEPPIKAKNKNEIQENIGNS